MLFILGPWTRPKLNLPHDPNFNPTLVLTIEVPMGDLGVCVHHIDRSDPVPGLLDRRRGKANNRESGNRDGRRLENDE